MAKSLLIAGTDTGVGKTALTAAFLAYWQVHFPNQTVSVFKPIQSGVGDREFYQNHFHLSQTAAEITPLQYEHPLAPPIAADLEARSVDLATVWTALQDLQAHSDQIFIEGIGGLGTPITHELTVADLARDWRLPTVLVVPVQLGALGQTIANVALARESKIDLKGIILSAKTADAANQVHELTPPPILEAFTNIPVMGLLNPIHDWDDTQSLAQSLSSLHLEKLWPQSTLHSKFKHH